MDSLRSRKRTRAQAFSDDPEISMDVVATNEEMDPEAEDPQAVEDRLQKEREIWESFREEHFEVVEQMPLTLHRQYTLMRELDQQTHGYMSDLLPTLKGYLICRQAMAPPAPAPVSPEQPMDINMEDTEEKHTVPAADNSDQMDVDSTAQPPQTPPPPAHRQQQSSNGTPSLPKLDLSSLPNPSTPLKGFRLEASATPRTPTPMGVPPERIKAPETTREMLSHIAWLSEELLRAGEEKVNLAQAAHDSVDRHIRLLDQAIKEQEASITLGVRSGTHISLPDILVPRYTRQARTAVSPVEDERGDSDGEADGMTLGVVSEAAAPHQGKRGRKGTQRKGRPRSDKPPPGGSHQQDSSGLTITLPPSNTAGAPPADSDELYCTCRQISHGEMVACDDDSCEFEWFHLGCIGFNELPSDDQNSKWYCADCRAKRGNRRRR